MRITVYRRHTKDCAHTDNKFYQRCECPVWFEAHVMGRRWDTESESWVKTPKYESIQSRWSSKQSNWRAAEHMARQFEHKLEDVITGRAPAAGSDKTVKDAVEQFLNEKATTITKRGQRISDDTLYRHEFTLKQLQEFCTEQGIVFLKDITLAHLRSWRTKWTVNAAHARRSFQERVKNFLTFCHTNGWIPTNPAAGLNSIPVVVGSDAIRPLTQEEYSRLLAAIDKTTMTAENKTRIKVLMQLQRQSGLSLVDAVCLAKDELVERNGVFRVVTDRQKTGNPINNVIKPELGRELLKVKNGNPVYFFWSGNTTPEDAPSYFHKLYRKVFKAAGIDGSSHDLRHTFAVEFLNGGGDMRVLQKALGHSSIQTTEKYYGKWSQQQQSNLDKALIAALETQ